MNDQVKNTVVLAVQQLLAGAKLENNKFEFKAKWYDFNFKNSEKVHVQKSEFYKDVCAVANCYGGEDGFIVIGIDNTGRKLSDTSIEDSGFTQDQVRNLILSNIDKPFSIDFDYVTVNGFQLSVIHIPITLDKPHLVSRFSHPTGHYSENVIFTRSGSATAVASKAEIDRMYWERKNIVVDKRAEVALNKLGSTFNKSGNSIIFQANITIENTGIRPLAIIKMVLKVALPDISGLSEIILSTRDRIDGTTIMILESGKIEQYGLTCSASIKLKDDESKNLMSWLNDFSQPKIFESFTLKISNGDNLYSSLSIV